jgi:drug/metabolite transporter (DMT)-like permease
MQPVALRVHLALVTVQLLFGSWPVAGRVMLQVIPGPALVGLRCLGACVLFFALLPRRTLARSLQLRTALAAFFGITVNQMLFIEGLTRTSAVNATVLITTIPVFTLLVSWAMGAEAPSVRRMVGMALAFGGALFVTGAQRLQMGDSHAVGNLFLLAGAAAYAVYLVLMGRLAREAEPMSLVPWVFLYGFITSLPLSVPSAAASLPWALTPGLILLLLYILLGPTVGTYFLNAVALRGAPPSLVAIYIYLQPLVAAVLAWPILGEIPSATLVLGALPIFAGVLLATRSP